MSQELIDALEFGLEGERYCVNISYVAEIIGLGELTSIPNTPDYTLGVMDFRGESLQVFDPKLVFGVDGEPTGERVIVLAEGVGDPEKRTGWLVDSVHEVLPIDPDAVDQSVEGEGVHGSVSREERLIVFVDPHEVFS